MKLQPIAIMASESFLEFIYDKTKYEGCLKVHDISFEDGTNEPM